MTDLIQRRVLSKPELLINASKDGGGVFNRFLPLNSYYVMIRGTDVLSLSLNEEISVLTPQRPRWERGKVLKLSRAT